MVIEEVSQEELMHCLTGRKHNLAWGLIWLEELGFCVGS